MRDTNIHVCERGQYLNIMRKHRQKIEECEHCGKVFEDGEDYWMDSVNKCYCVDNSCGWEDDEDEE